MAKTNSPCYELLLQKRERQNTTELTHLYITESFNYLISGHYEWENVYQYTIHVSKQTLLQVLQITGQTMPGITGSDLSRRMLQIRSDIPIILCTGYSTIISEGKTKSMGIKEFVFKPLAKKNIATLIRKVLDVS